MSDQELETRRRHDLKNQLGIVLGFSELLLAEMDQASPHRPDVDEIYRAALKALELIAEPKDQIA